MYDKILILLPSMMKVVCNPSVQKENFDRPVRNVNCYSNIWIDNYPPYSAWLTYHALLERDLYLYGHLPKTEGYYFVHVGTSVLSSVRPRLPSVSPGPYLGKH